MSVDISEQHYVLTQDDLRILEGYKSVVDVIANVFGNTCECVLHSLDALESSVIYIHNGAKTNRSIGSPITDKALSILAQAEDVHKKVIGPYQTVGADGHKMRSSTMIIYNHEAKPRPIGMLCLNLDLDCPLSLMCSEFFNFSSNFVNNTTGFNNSINHQEQDLTDTNLKALNSSINQSSANLSLNREHAHYLPQEQSSLENNQPLISTLLNFSQVTDNEYFAKDISDLFANTVNKTSNEVLSNNNISRRNKTKEIILSLERKGIFKVRNSVNQVADLLNISKDVVYLHLRNSRKEAQKHTT